MSFNITDLTLNITEYKFAYSYLVVCFFIPILSFFVTLFYRVPNEQWRRVAAPHADGSCAITAQVPTRKSQSCQTRNRSLGSPPREGGCLRFVPPIHARPEPSTHHHLILTVTRGFYFFTRSYLVVTVCGVRWVCVVGW